MNANAGREHAQQSLNRLAPDQIAAVVHVMEVLLDPLSRKLANAPVEDEEISEAEETVRSGVHVKGFSSRLK